MLVLITEQMTKQSALDFIIDNQPVKKKQILLHGIILDFQGSAVAGIQRRIGDRIESLHFTSWRARA
jgi:hypothetical protein